MTLKQHENQVCPELQILWSSQLCSTDAAWKYDQQIAITNMADKAWVVVMLKSHEPSLY